ncbi:hypothetical protein LTR37_007693 [Vermiconidia calcicola]|uniref:Uncharacterized protein n=1 Tax=Vermiconidia calcicola TaxID=1690605 RepID=A0ACC3NCW0_9PEZI|nr:hypothetical protein LTR37_007693 [Vermiconidia calcicola]
MPPLKFSTILLMLFLHYIGLATCGSNSTARRITNERRWFSLLPVPANGDLPDRDKAAWPPVYELDSARHRVTVHAVRYCFIRGSDYDSVNDVLRRAIEMWEPAMQMSLLRFRPGNKVGGRGNICGEPGMRSDAVQIEQGYGKTATSVGYNYASSRERRHYMKFTRRDQTRVTKSDYSNMAHELGEPALLSKSTEHSADSGEGHAIGFYHEFARPDRNQHVDFRCENLFDYDRVKHEIETAPHAPGHDTIELACRDANVANEYGFSALNYVPWDETRAMWTQWSRKFDRESIMMYHWRAGAKKGANAVWPDDAVLLGKEADGSKYRTFEGGIEDPEAPEISAGDIVRVAQLYPDPNNARAAGIVRLPEWQPVEPNYWMGVDTVS